MFLYTKLVGRGIRCVIFRQGYAGCSDPPFRYLSRVRGVECPRDESLSVRPPVPLVRFPSSSGRSGAGRRRHIETTSFGCRGSPRVGRRRRSPLPLWNMGVECWVVPGVVRLLRHSLTLLLILSFPFTHWVHSPTTGRPEGRKGSRGRVGSSPTERPHAGTGDRRRKRHRSRGPGGVVARVEVGHVGITPGDTTLWTVGL